MLKVILELIMASVHSEMISDSQIESVKSKSNVSIHILLGN